MGIEHQSMLKIIIPTELPEGFDPVDMQRELQEMVKTHLPLSLSRKVSSRQQDSFESILEVVRPNIENIQMELAEILESLPWKYWKHSHVERLNDRMTDEERMEFVFELADVLHFLINMLIVVGGNWDLLMKIFYAKQLENRRRQEEGY